MNLCFVINALLIVLVKALCAQSRQFDDVQLSNLTLSTGIVIKGNHPNDLAGSAMSNIGDINGDGIDDFVIGASVESGYLRSVNGIIYVVYGQRPFQTTGFSLANITALHLGFRILGGMSNSRTGFSIANGGDIDKDGFNDLIIGAIAADPSPLKNRLNCGAVYVVYGGISGYDDVDLAVFVWDTSRGFTIMGAMAGEYLGTSVTAAGDFNHDGYADILIGAMNSSPKGRNNAGAAYLIFGNARGSLGFLDLFPIYNRSSSNSTHGYAFFGAQADDYTGCSVATADMDGDGNLDLIIGAYNGNYAGRTHNGKVYVVYGGSTGMSSWGKSNVDFAHAYPFSTMMTIYGGQNYDYAGFAVVAGKDLNGDSLPDLVLGAPTVTTNINTFTNGGAAYVIYGRTSKFTGNIDLATPLDVQSTGCTILGVHNQDFVGGSLAFCGDVDGDSMEDLCVGEYFNTMAGHTAVKFAYVILGQRHGLQNVNFNAFTHRQGYRIEGAFASGMVVSRAGDINQDGLDDVLIGAPYANHKAGMVYVVFGQPDPFPTSEPTSQPSRQPTSQPTAQPSIQPTGQPTSRPTWQMVHMATYFTMYYAKRDPMSSDAGKALVATIEGLLGNHIFVTYEGEMDGYRMDGTVTTQSADSSSRIVTNGPGYAYIIKTIIHFPQEYFPTEYHQTQNASGLMYTYAKRILTPAVQHRTFDVYLRNMSAQRHLTEFVNITTVKVEYESFTRLTSDSASSNTASTTFLITLIVCLVVGMFFVVGATYFVYHRYGYFFRNCWSPDADYDEIDATKNKQLANHHPNHTVSVQPQSPRNAATTGKTAFQQQADLRHSANIGAFYDGNKRNSRFMYDQPEDAYDANPMDEEEREDGMDGNGYMEDGSEGGRIDLSGVELMDEELAMQQQLDATFRR